MDENSFQRIRNIISKHPRKHRSSWSQLTNKQFLDQIEVDQHYDPVKVEKYGQLVKDFLEVHVECINYIESKIFLIKICNNKRQLKISSVDCFWRRGD